MNRPLFCYLLRKLIIGDSQSSAKNHTLPAKKTIFSTIAVNDSKVPGSASHPVKSKPNSDNTLSAEYMINARGIIQKPTKAKTLSPFVFS